MRRESSAWAVPVSICTCQVWVLVPEGAREATARICSIVSRGTGVGRKARIERRLVMAASTAAVVSGVMFMAGPSGGILGRCAGSGTQRLERGAQRGRQRCRATAGAVDVDMDEVAGRGNCSGAK